MEPVDEEPESSATEEPGPQEDIPERSEGISTEKLNRIIAVCAILISGASFYATYLQAKSAEKQVQAMTLPLIQFGHGNWDPERKKSAISFRLDNGGVGPAILKRVVFEYRDTEYRSMHDFFAACCGEEWRRYRRSFDDLDQIEAIGDYSKPLVDVIIPGQTSYVFQVTEKTELSEAFWLELNRKRWALGLEACYCSLLDECYVTDGSGVFEPVGTCSEP